MSYFTQVSYSDTGSLDAFSRLRASSPSTVLAVQNQYNSSPLQMEVGATGTGVTPTHSANTRMTSISATAGSGTSFTQSYMYTPYDPGKSHLIALTFVIGTGVAGVTTDVGYFDAANGVILRQNGITNLQFILRTSTSGSVSDANIVNQSAWNIDKLDGTGASALTLDITKSQILIIDLQFLGMGRVRIGFDINGVIFYAHQFLNANSLTTPYMQTATLPIGMLVTATASGSTKTAFFKCASVESEGGAVNDAGFHFSTPEVTATAGNNSRVPLLAIRPKTTFNGITNRELFVMEDFNIVVTGATLVFWELVIGGAYSGQTYADVNTTYSGYEYTSVPGAITNLTGGVVLDSGYAAPTGGGAGGVPVSNMIESAIGQSLKHPITLDRAGAVRALGTLTLLVTGVGATSACRGTLTYKEVR